jgi:hypothetical protein
MKAYEVKYKTTVQVIDENVITAPGSIPVRQGDIITLHRLDGMYCFGTNTSGERIYIAAGTQIRRLPPKLTNKEE